MTYLRTAFLATTAVGLMALATPAFAEIITTPDGHYYKMVPLKAPPPGAASSGIMAIPEGATASVAPAPASNCRLTNFVNLEYQPQYTAVCGPQKVREYIPRRSCPRARRVRGHPRATPRKTWDLDRIERRRRGS